MRFCSLWKIAIDFASVEESDKNDSIIFYDQPNSIVPKSNAIVATFCPEFLKILDVKNTDSSFHIFNRLLETLEERSVLNSSQISGKTRSKFQRHADSSRSFKTSCLLTGFVFSPSWIA